MLDDDGTRDRIGRRRRERDGAPGLTRARGLGRAWPIVLLVLAACTSTPTTPTAPPAAGAVPTAPAPSGPSLLDEERRLAALFDGTPVVFSMQSSTALRVEVPLRFCFDAGQSAVKPPLAAVVDRLAQSQRDRASRFLVSAPGDGPVRPKPAAAAASAQRSGAAASSVRNAARDVATVASRRAASLRDRLAAQGIDPMRTTIADSDAPGIRIVVTDAPSP